MKPHCCLHSMFSHIVLLIALLVSMVGAQDITFLVPGRIIQQWADLCTRSTQIKLAWDNLSTFPGGYPVQTKPLLDWGYRCCFETTLEAKNVICGALVAQAYNIHFIEFCRTARASLFNWKKFDYSNGMLLYWGNNALLY